MPRTEGHPLLRVEVERSAGIIRVLPTGELDLSNVDQLAKVLAAERAAATEIVLDLERLSFIDSTGLKLVLETDAASRMDGFGLSLRPGPPNVMRTFAVSGLDKLLPFKGLEPT